MATSTAPPMTNNANGTFERFEIGGRYCEGTESRSLSRLRLRGASGAGGGPFETLGGAGSLGRPFAVKTFWQPRHRTLRPATSCADSSATPQSGQEYWKCDIGSP